MIYNNENGVSMKTMTIERVLVHKYKEHKHVYMKEIVHAYMYKRNTIVILIMIRKTILRIMRLKEVRMTF